MAHLKVQNIGKTFGDFVAVDDVSLDFPDGQLTALLGPSGCGKTTLLRMIAGLEAPTRGQITLDGQDITAKPAHQRRFGMVFQSLALFPHLNVTENVAYSMSIAGVDKRERTDKALELLDLVQLSKFAHRRVGELSGGQRQRVAIARALAQNPRVFLLDEPMSALDAKLREDMQVELRLLQEKLGITTIVVTHDQREAMTMADQIVVMNVGVAEQVGSPQVVYDRPASPFVASFIGKANTIDGVVRGGSIDCGGCDLLPDPPASYLDGSTVKVMCRPETVRVFIGADAVMAGLNRVPATVTFIRDVGATREVMLDAGGVKLVSEMPSAIGMDIAVGNQVAAELPPTAIRVFPASDDTTVDPDALAPAHTPDLAVE